MTFRERILAALREAQRDLRFYRGASAPETPPCAPTEAPRVPEGVACRPAPDPLVPPPPLQSLSSGAARALSSGVAQAGGPVRGEGTRDEGASEWGDVALVVVRGLREALRQTRHERALGAVYALRDELVDGRAEASDLSEAERSALVRAFGAEDYGAVAGSAMKLSVLRHRAEAARTAVAVVEKLLRDAAASPPPPAGATRPRPDNVIFLARAAARRPPAGGTWDKSKRSGR